jgi:hypothetical protein
MSDQQVTFSVKGRPLATFHFNSKSQSFMAYNDRSNNEYCIKIIIKDAVHLADYFYEAANRTFPCAMKPSTVAEHKLYLDTLLEFLAYVFDRQEIYVFDDAVKKYDHCPPLETSIFLTAGYKSFYEKMAGFKNPTVNRVARKTRRKYGSTAKSILLSCKANRPITSDDREALNQMSKAFYQELHKVGDMVFRKKVTRTYTANVTHGGLFVDIIPGKKNKMKS